jgi:hypothetical protein
MASDDVGWGSGMLIDGLYDLRLQISVALISIPDAVATGFAQFYAVEYMHTWSPFPLEGGRD